VEQRGIEPLTSALRTKRTVQNQTPDFITSCSRGQNQAFSFSLPSTPRQFPAFL
jgi:hypothetical protein